jgi:YHS domain-containing protein
MQFARIKLLSLVTGVALALGAAVLIADTEEAKPTTQPYPLTTCVVAGSKLGSRGDPYVHYHEGREVRFCCKGCLGAFNKDPAKYIAKIDAAQTGATTQPATQPSGEVQDHQHGH